MNHNFQGWDVVAECLRTRAKISDSMWLDAGQKASLISVAQRIPKNGLIIADEVGMGKTRIAVEVAASVIESGGRVAILVPPGLGYQWQKELRDGGVECPAIIRSLRGFLNAWEADDESDQKPWFKENLLMVSHAFTNWRLSDSSRTWRWALLPELYAQWRKRTSNRLPRGYNDNKKLDYALIYNAASSIIDAIPANQEDPAHRLICQLSERTPWPQALDGNEYGRNNELRPWLERAVGLGLGIFDLIIIDEAHKSRGMESGLSRLLSNVIQQSDSSRRFAMTATPVELNIDQWWHTLSRIGATDLGFERDDEENAIHQYTKAVKRVRDAWHSSQARDAYKLSASRFQNALSPYLVRRDKREDAAVKLFHRHSGLPINEYRKDLEIKVDTASLSPSWLQAICAAEALSFVTRLSDTSSVKRDSSAKRLRLTLGNGHGIATLLTEYRQVDEGDRKQEMSDEDESEIQPIDGAKGDSKRHERIEWWLKAINLAFTEGNDSLQDPLYHHPAIKAAVTAIESATEAGEKVLVFGRFTKPLRALVDLLNAREMLRRLRSGRPWPEAKVRQDGTTDRWPSVRAAHGQLASELQLGSLDESALDQALEVQYGRLEYQRQKFRDKLIENLELGFKESCIPESDDCFIAFQAFKRSVEKSTENDLALLSRVLLELLGPTDADDSSTPEPAEFVRAFRDLLASCQFQKICSADFRRRVQPSSRTQSASAFCGLRNLTVIQ